MSRAVDVSVAAVRFNSTTMYNESYSVVELRAIAKEKRIKGCSSMNKAELLEVLNNGY